jgi:hypothetical protein
MWRVLHVNLWIFVQGMLNLMLLTRLSFSCLAAVSLLKRLRAYDRLWMKYTLLMRHRAFLLFRKSHRTYRETLLAWSHLTYGWRSAGLWQHLVLWPDTKRSEKQVVSMQWHRPQDTFHGNVANHLHCYKHYNSEVLIPQFHRRENLVSCNETSGATIKLQIWRVLSKSWSKNMRGLHTQV